MTFKFIRIPIDRIGALIGRSGSTKKWIEDTCKVDLSIDSKVGEVSIDSSVDSDPFKALDLIKAISFGFSKSRSSILLHEDEFLSVIDLKLYSGKSSNSLSRIKGRIIGYNGKARKVLEELTRANISVYGHYVAIIGTHEQIALAEDAINILASGGAMPIEKMNLAPSNRARLEDMIKKPHGILLVVGPTGSGKTTLMRLIYFDLLPDAGWVKVNGFSSKKMTKRKIPNVRKFIGMVFQDYKLLYDRNLFENVALPLHVLGYSGREIPDRVEEALELVGLEGKDYHLPNELSGGEQQRACLARAIIKEPDILLADEPTGNLDPVASFELVRLLETIHETGTTIIMASHNYNLIKGRGRPIYELKDGILRGR